MTTLIAIVKASLFLLVALSLFCLTLFSVAYVINHTSASIEKTDTCASYLYENPQGMPIHPDIAQISAVDYSITYEGYGGTSSVIYFNSMEDMVQYMTICAE